MTGAHFLYYILQFANEHRGASCRLTQHHWHLEFMNLIRVWSRSIPFTIKDDRVEKSSAFDLFMKQRKAAESSYEPEMTLEDINAEIRAAREEKYGR